jgi:hypothetical protein
MNASLRKPGMERAKRAAFAVLFALMCMSSLPARAQTVTVAAARPLSPAAEKRIREQALRHIADLNNYLDYDFNKPVRIFVAATQREFQRETGPDAPHWAVALASGRKVFMGPGASASAAEFDATLKHELAHVALHDMFVRRPQSLPRWLDEGLAVTISGTWEMPEAWAASRRDLYAALRDGEDMPLSEINGGFPASEWKARIAYAQSAHFTEYLYERFGRDRMNEFLKRLARGEDFDKAFRAATGKRFDRVEEYWRGRMRGKSAVGLFLLGLMHFDTMIWALMALLVVLGFLRFMVKRGFGRSARRHGADDYLDDDDEDIDEWEYWDEDAMGHKPWRPGRDD